MPNDPRAPTSALVCRRSFEPAHYQQQLRSQAYERLVPTGSRSTTAAARQRQRAGRGAVPAVSNPSGGICA